MRPGGQSKVISKSYIMQILANAVSTLFKSLVSSTPIPFLSFESFSKEEDFLLTSRAVAIEFSSTSGSTVVVGMEW